MENNSVTYEILYNRYQNYLQDRNPLTLLGLNNDYDEESLKKAYRQCVRLVHPDKRPNDEVAQRIAQEVNDAYDVLNRKYKGPLPNWNLGHTETEKGENKHQPVDFYKYRDEKIEELKNRANSSGIVADFFISMYIRNIKKIQADACFDIVFSGKNKSQIDEIYNKTIQNIKEELKNMARRFYERTSIIDVFEKKPSIDYDVPLNEFIWNLKQIENEFSLSVIVRKSLEEKAKEYENYAGYSAITSLITSQINYLSSYRLLAPSYYKKSESEKLDEINKYINAKKEEFVRNVEEYFSSYHIIKQGIMSLEQRVNQINDIELNNAYSKLVEKLTNIDDVNTFKELKDNIAEIEKMLASKAYKVINENNINSFFAKAGTILQKNNIDLNIKITIVRILNNITSIYNRWLQERDPMAVALLSFLNQIDLNNIENGNADEIKNYTLIFCEKSHIYLKRGNSNNQYNNEGTFYYVEPIDEKNLQIYAIQGFYVINEYTITMDDLYTNFLPIEAVMLDAKEAKGMTIDNNTSMTLHFVEETKGYYLYSYIDPGSPLMDVIGLKEGRVSINNSSNPYKNTVLKTNKDEFVQKLETQIKMAINIYKNKQEQKNTK